MSDRSETAVANNEAAVTVGTTGERPQAWLTRWVEHAPERVWAMLIEPRELVNWLAPAEVEPCAGGRISVDFGDSGAVIDSRFMVFDPPRRLVYAWGSGEEPERPLDWQLEAVDGGTSLQLHLTLPAGEDIAKAAAGWDAHLEMLLAALEGVPIHFPVDHFLARRRELAARREAVGAH